MQLLLPKANIYRLSTIESICTNPPTVNPRPKQLADYIACSSFLHLADAWSYISGASAAAALGDPDVATHLGYYAELRACMALLATQGVGVFDSKSKHFLITNRGRAQVAGTGSTHDYSWEAFRDWAINSGWTEMSATVRPGGAPIRDWIQSFPSFAAAPAIGANMLQEFGMDVAMLGTDRRLRNEASYRPTALRYIRSEQPSAELGKRARSIETLISGGQFGDCPLATAILARVLANSFEAARGTTVQAAPGAFAAEIGLMLAGGPVPTSANFQNAVIAFAHNSPMVLSDALGNTPSNQRGHHHQVLARATILCFLAALFVRDLAMEAGIGAQTISFWMEGFATDRGVYDLPAPIPVSDLWADIEDAVHDADNVAVVNPSQLIIQSTQASVIASLCQFERMLVLGLST